MGIEELLISFTVTVQRYVSPINLEISVTKYSLSGNCNRKGMFLLSLF